MTPVPAPVPIADVAARILARRAPVLVTDTCCFLDLFRVARPTKETEERRIEPEELEAAKNLLAVLAAPNPRLHHVVPELVPGEFRENAEPRVAQPFRKWVDAHDVAGQWIPAAATAAGLAAAPAPALIGPFNLPGQFRDFAERLLGTATVLARDLPCLLRAVDRLVAKRRPSHRKEMKDSMNLEQVLELGRLLSASAPYPDPVVFVSSNTNDFAAPSNRTDVHPELKAEFAAAGLSFRTSLRAVLGLLGSLRPGD